MPEIEAPAGEDLESAAQALNNGKESEMVATFGRSYSIP